MLKINKIWLFCLIGLIVTACSISYKFNGASIDYTKVKDIYIRQTRLQLVGSNGDLDLEGEITGYDLTPMAVKEDAYASQTKLTITVRVRYANRVNPDEDFEQSFSAYREFDATQMLQQVQDQLSEEIIDELVDQIYNATVANW